MAHLGPPIAIFAYRRPDHVRRLLASLASNPESADSPTFIYCDGPRTIRDEEAVEATRQVIRTHAPAHAEIVEHHQNLGLSRSIIDGVSTLCDRFGRVIVLEDDLVLSPAVLGYFRAALECYAHDDRVMHVSAYVFPVEKPLPETFFYRGTSCWGWATWARAWRHFSTNGLWLRREIVRRRLVPCFEVEGAYPYLQMLDDQIMGRNDSWAVRWHASVLLRDGLSLHPGRSLAANTGFDNSGEHCKQSDVFATHLAETAPAVRPIPVEEDSDALAAIREYFRGTVLVRSGSEPSRGSRRRSLRRVLRRVLCRIKAECFGRWGP